MKEKQQQATKPHPHHSISEIQGFLFSRQCSTETPSRQAKQEL